MSDRLVQYECDKCGSKQFHPLIMFTFAPLRCEVRGCGGMMVHSYPTVYEPEKTSDKPEGTL